MTAFAAKEVTTEWSNDALWSPNYLKEIGPGGSLGLWENAYDIEVLEDANGNLYYVDEYGIKQALGVDADGFVYYLDEKGNPLTDDNGDIIYVAYGQQNQFVSAKDANGHAVDISWRTLSAKTLKSIDSEGKIADIFKDNGYDVPDDTDFIPLLSGNITFDEGVPQGGGVVTFQLADLGVNSEGVQPGETVYLMQETAPGSGVWEVYAATVGQAGDVVVNIPRNGAFVLVKTLSDGTVVTLDKTTGEEINRVPADNVANNNASNNNANGTTSTSTNAAGGATSPKTGEF